MTLAELRTQLVEVAGLDLTESEANALINEGYRELCVQSEWTRAAIELGPGIDGTSAYDMPTRVHHILKLSIDGVPANESDRETVEQIVLGNGEATTPLWWITFTDDGSEQITVYPTPSGGEEINALAVVYPTDDLVDDADVPVTPRSNGDRAIINYVTAMVLGGAEDDVERRDYFSGEFLRLVAEVKALRYMRGSRKPFQVRIQGVNA